jgi:hypothetical protein
MNPWVVKIIVSTPSKEAFMQKKRNLVLVLISVVTLVASFAFADPGSGFGPGGRGAGPGICKTCK